MRPEDIKALMRLGVPLAAIEIPSGSSLAEPLSFYEPPAYRHAFARDASLRNAAFRCNGLRVLAQGSGP
jgi:hypothetical protein